MKALEKIKSENLVLSESEIIDLLRIDTSSGEFYELLELSNTLSRRKFGKRGYVFTQVGINAEPCPINCKFCSMGAGHYSLDSQREKTPGEVCSILSWLQESYLLH